MNIERWDKRPTYVFGDAEVEMQETEALTLSEALEDVRPSVPQSTAGD